MITVYGIRNCTTMKRAFAWFEEHGIDYVFHDYKKSGVPRADLERWAERLGWRTLLNSQGPTWRKLPDADKADLTPEKLMALVAAHPSLIRRPVVEAGEQLLVGFDPALFAKALRDAIPPR